MPSGRSSVLTHRSARPLRLLIREVIRDAIRCTQGGHQSSRTGAPGRCASSANCSGLISGARSGASCSAVTAPPLARMRAAAAADVRCARFAFGLPSPKTKEKQLCEHGN